MIDDVEFVKIKNKSEAIRKLYPQVVTITPGEVWECVDKNNVSVKIDESKVTKEVDRADAEYDAQEYARKREAEYPSIEECVHAILDDDLDALQAKRAEIKTKYPKGE